MTSFDYARSRATAERLIAKFGMAGAIRRKTSTGPAYDPSFTTTDYLCKLVVLNYEDSKIDGSLIRRTDKMIYLSTEGLSITPTEADSIVAETAYQIINIKPLSPAGTVVFWEIQARS
jgi:hypothetical protein